MKNFDIYSIEYAETQNWYRVPGDGNDAYPSKFGDVWKDNIGTPSDEAAIHMAKRPVGTWNTMSVVAEDCYLTIILNGVLINHAGPYLPCHGRIALETEGAPIDFRNIVIKYNDITKVG